MKVSKINQDVIDILMVGSSTKVKGGMTTVVESFLNNKSFKNIKIKYVPTHIDAKNNTLKKCYFFLRLIQIFFILVFGNIRIVHMHMSERGSFNRKFFIFKISKFLNKLVITHTHGAEFKEYYGNSDYNTKIQIKTLLSQSDLVITLGERWDNIIKDIEPNSKTLVLKNAVEMPHTVNNLNDQEIKILFLAVLIERKGILDLIDASKEIIHKLEREGKKVKFYIAGDGDLRECSEKMVQDMGLKSYFQFEGWVNNKQKTELLQKTDLFILPSYNEGLPLSILEAISYGIPIIATNVGSIEEAVKNNKNGYLIKPGNIKELEEKTIKLLVENQIHEFGRMSRRIAEQDFDIYKYFAAIEKQYVELDRS